MPLEAPSPFSTILAVVDDLQRDQSLLINVSVETYGRIQKVVHNCRSPDHPLTNFLTHSADRWNLKAQILEILLPPLAVRALARIPLLRESQAAAIESQDFEIVAQLRDQIAERQRKARELCGDGLELEFAHIAKALQLLGYDGPLE